MVSADFGECRGVSPTELPLGTPNPSACLARERAAATLIDCDCLTSLKAVMPTPVDDDPEDFAEAIPEDDTDDEYLPPPEVKRRGPGVWAMLLALVAVGCLGVVAYAPDLAWFHIDLRNARTQEQWPLIRLSVDGSGQRTTEIGGKAAAPGDQPFPRLPADVAPHGTWIRYLAIGNGLWVVLGMLLLLVTPGGEWYQRLSTIVPGIAICLAVTLTVWSLGWLIKVVMLSRLIAERVDETPGLPRIGLQVETHPGLGLYLAMGGAIVAAVALSALMQWCLRRRSSQAFSGLGVLAGAVILAVVVRPWTAEALWRVLFA